VTTVENVGTTQGIVMSSLFGRDASDVVVSCDGAQFRCAVSGTRPVVGDRVGLTIRRALFYPDPTQVAAPALGAAALASTSR